MAKTRFPWKVKNEEPRPNEMAMETMPGSRRDLEKSDLVKTLAESRAKAASFWENASERITFSDDYVPDFSGAPSGYKPGDTKVSWYPDTSKWPLYYRIDKWPPPRGVILNTTMVYKACKFMTGGCRGHQYPGNFSKNGSIRPDVPPFGPARAIKSNGLTLSPIHLGYYGMVPETVAREVGYLIRRKTNDNTEIRQRTSPNDSELATTQDDLLKFLCPFAKKLPCPQRFPNFDAAKLHALIGHQNQESQRKFLCPRAREEKETQSFLKHVTVKHHALIQNGNDEPEEYFARPWPTAPNIPLRDVEGKMLPDWDKLPEVIRVNGQSMCPEQNYDKRIANASDLRAHYLAAHMNACWPCQFFEATDCKETAR
ncbi:hypothetical protein N7528_000222 [Penicillium herquei]|nr:hypothetical protein N7528_000222 [Penicillium herquei]